MMLGIANQPTVVPYTGVAFDGASTTAHPPTLSNSNRTASFTLDGTGGSVFAAVLSAASRNTGKWFYEFTISANGATAAADAVFMLAAGASFDVNNIPTTASAFLALVSQNGAAVGYMFGSIAALEGPVAPAPTVPARLGIYFDCDAHTFGVVTPDNVQHNSTAVLPSGAIKIGMVAQRGAAGPATFTATIETTPTLTPPVGYTNWAA